ncbi:hypothetical protein F8A86_11680 [Betaproteobacteria bacterium SCN1]|jgi:hypothetical protein|nr:hypothetical protein F8A86_11680 [Betaproteobacteria bacterium SCN1]
MSRLSTNAFDKRPFKGKGAVEWLSRSRKALERVLFDMEILAEESRRVSGSPWYLYLHYRRDTGQRFLMWRSYGLNHVHLRWEQMQGVLQRMTPDQRNWYVETNEKARLLNAKEKAARTALNLANGLLEGDED